jgi:hypothetical protein
MAFVTLFVKPQIKTGKIAADWQQTGCHRGALLICRDT